MTVLRASWILILGCIPTFAQTDPQPGSFYCQQHGSISCRGQGFAACESAVQAHECDPRYHPENRCSGQSPPPIPDPPNPLRVVGPPAAFGAIGWLVGEQSTSTTTGKSMGLPGLYSGVTLGGLVTTAVIAKRAPAAVTALAGAATGLAGGQALTEYNKAQDKEPNQAMNAGIGAGLGLAGGVMMDIVNENSRPDWLRRRLGTRARILGVASPRFVGVVLSW